jgi:hypothetical protein
VDYGFFIEPFLIGAHAEISFFYPFFYLTDGRGIGREKLLTILVTIFLPGFALTGPHPAAFRGGVHHPQNRERGPANTDEEDSEFPHPGSRLLTP